MTHSLLPASLAAAVVAGTAVQAEGDATRGAAIARVECAKCHGADGNARTTSIQPVPMLAGQPEIYLLREMKNYVARTREDTSKGGRMTEVLEQLADAQLEDLAAYFAVQKRY